MIEYNTIAGKDDYTIKFHTDNWERYREIEEHIRQLIDKSVAEKEEKSYLSKAMSQSADKIMECVQKQTTQALEEVLERQDEEIAQKAIEETKKRAKLRDFIESIGITDEKQKKIFKAIHPETLFDVIDGEYEKIKVRGIRELAECRGFHGDYNLSSETAAKALTILFADICDNQQQQINDLQTQIKNLNKRMDRCNID